MAQDYEHLAFIQQSESNLKSELIIDVNQKNGAYPSLEEEMSIYMALKDARPQAFFFPSPSNGIVWIEHNLGDEVLLTVTDMDGERLYTANDMNVKKLDMRHFRAGRYLLSLEGQKGLVKRYISVK
jgi:hypothetical protein